MGKFLDNIPTKSLELVNYSGSELLNRLGKDIISNVVASVLCGDNIRDLTEGLTQRRILLMNSSLFVTYIRALSSFDNLNSQLTSIIAKEVKTRGITPNEKRYLLWFIGLTGKSIQNVIRDDDGFAKYLSNLDKNLKEISNDVEKTYGKLELSVSNKDKNVLLNWPDLLRCMLALGAQTLTIRGSEKSMYGKLFEKFILGSVLTMLGFQLIDKDDTRKNDMVFWLSERKEKRESDATALLRRGAGIRFDIGFIGKGNTEVSLDKVSRFEREMERGGQTHFTKTIILVDRIGSNSRIGDMAQNIGGSILQMSGTYWVYELAEVIKTEFPFFEHEILKQNRNQSLEYIKNKMKEVDLSQFISYADAEDFD